jgi:DNA gyrase subunit A
LAVRAGDELVIISRQGQVVRTSVDQIRSVGRAAQGVTIVNLADGDALSSVAICPRDENAKEAPSSEVGESSEGVSPLDPPPTDTPTA